MTKKGLKYTLASKVLYNFDQSTPEEKKNNEISIARGFIDRLQLKIFEMKQDDPPCPDFFLEFNSRRDNVTVGLELTNYYSGSGKSGGSSEVVSFKKWVEFAKDLRDSLDKENQQYIYGAIHFNRPTKTLLKKINQKELKQTLIKEIIQAVRSQNFKDQGTLQDFDQEKFPALAKFIGKIYIKNTTPEVGIWWWASHLQSGMIDYSAERLLEIIKDKNDKKYDWKGSQEKWLLV